MNTPLPLIEILNQNFIQDLHKLNEAAKKRGCQNGEAIINQVKTTEPIRFNFDLLTKYLSDKEAREKDIKSGAEVQQFIHALTIYTNAYINLNNEIAELLQTLKNVSINDLIMEIEHNRYTKIKDILSKPEYKNDYQQQIIKLVDQIITSTQAPEINELEIQFNNQLASYMMVLTKNKVLNREDDYAIALFSISNGVCSRLFQALFFIIQQNKHNSENLNSATSTSSSQPTSNSPKSEGKILTKEIPADGPPKDYKKAKKI